MPWIVAAELFATTLDVYLTLGSTPEDANDRDTADGRPATREHARARLARMYCADVEMVPEENIRILAEGIRDNQLKRIRGCIETLRERLKAMPSNEVPKWARKSHVEKLFDERTPDPNAEKTAVQFIVSGSGEFLAQRAIDKPHHVSLNDELGPEVSACAPAYAVAVLATERRP